MLITVTPSGPYDVGGGVPLSRQAIVADPELTQSLVVVDLARARACHQDVLRAEVYREYRGNLRGAEVPWWLAGARHRWWPPPTSPAWSSLPC